MKERSAHYLVASKSKPRSDLALKTAEALAALTGAALTVLVITKPSARKGKSATRTLAALRELLPAAQVIARSGPPGKAISEEAASGGHSLIILGQHLAPGRLRRLFKKPVIREVIEETNLPVLIVKETAASLDRLLLCDGGEQQPSILQRFEGQLPEFLDAAREVTVLHVMSQISAQPGAAGEDLLATAEELMAVNAHEGEVLEQDVEHLHELQTTPRPLVRHGLVVDEIVAEAASGAYDLVIIGAHRQEPWTDLLLEDLAGQIVREIEQTVLIVR